jgi:hypothetical protein
MFAITEALSYRPVLGSVALRKTTCGASVCATHFGDAVQGRQPAHCLNCRDQRPRF